MMWRKAWVIGLVLILIMTMAAVPVYALAGNPGEGSEHGAEVNATANVTVSVNATVNTTGLQQASWVILHIVDRLANYTESLMANSTNVSNETVALFNHAEELRQEAWALYNGGNYKDALHKAIDAMRAYKRVIVSLRCKVEAEGKVEVRSNFTIAKIEALRMRGYFKHVELVIRVAKMRGVDTTKIEELYNQTREAYEKVVIDVKSGNSTALTKDLKTARELKRQLDEAIRELNRELLKIRGKRIVMAFETKLEMQLELLTWLQNIPGINASVVENLRQQLMQLHQNVTQLLREGKIKEALALIKVSTPRLKVVAMYTHWIRMGSRGCWAQGNASSSVNCTWGWGSGGGGNGTNSTNCWGPGCWWPGHSGGNTSNSTNSTSWWWPGPGDHHGGKH